MHLIAERTHLGRYFGPSGGKQPFCMEMLHLFLKNISRTMNMSPLAVCQTSHCSTCTVCLPPSKPPVQCMVTLPLFAEEKSETQRGWALVQSHTANKWQTRDLNVDLLPPQPELGTATRSSELPLKIEGSTPQT